MWKNIEAKDLTQNIFTLIGDQWMLVTAGTTEKCNTMTASWGGLVVLWGKPTATIYIRPQRYTREFIEAEEYFTLSFFDSDYKKELALCGSKSGRELDKVAQCGFTVLEGEGKAPYFDQASLVLVCRKRYVQKMDPDAIPEDVKEKFYPEKDYHYVYVAEIAEVLVKE